MPPVSRRAFLLATSPALLGLGWVAWRQNAPRPVTVPAAERLRGVTVSCQTSGWEWGDPAMARTMDDLRGLGANAIAFHPYARISADGQVSWPQEEHPASIVNPLAWAHERGMTAMIVPHIAYWGSPFQWRGEIDFAADAVWERFFADYERWIVALARLAEEGRAPLFCIGLEYTHAQKFDTRWRRIIAAVRSVYHGRLTYGANWNEVEAVPFWDALDHVGVLAYFPICDAPNPTSAQLDAGWARREKELAAVSARTGKSVLFVELGYDAHDDAAAHPWADHGPVTTQSRDLQCRCLAAGLRTVDRAPWLAGVFLWKWFPDLPGHHRESFDLRAPETRAVIRAAWSPT